MDPAVPGTGKEAGTLEHTKVLRNRRKRYVERCGELCHRPLSGSQARQNRAPRRVGERGERQVEGRALILNHKVKYTGGGARVK